jgi:hypothetical protein
MVLTEWARLKSWLKTRRGKSAAGVEGDVQEAVSNE